jgi:ATP-dependent Clp protease protease subunit
MLGISDRMRIMRPGRHHACVGQAVDVGAGRLAAGTAGKRAAPPHSRIVLHQPAPQLKDHGLNNHVLTTR